MKTKITGGLGIIAGGAAPVDYIREEIHKARAITDKPLGMNIMLLSPNADDLAQLAIDEKIEVLTTGAGNPGKYIADWKNAGIKVMPVVASVALAKRMERAGADAVIAEGMEGGGHIGELTTMPLVPQVVDALSIPVIAAGGIADGRGMAAAMMLGAEGVQCGTIFLATPECQISEKYKELVLKATDISTVVTGRPSGHPVRSLKTPMARKCLELEKQNTDASLEELEKATAGSLRKAVQDGKQVAVLVPTTLLVQQHYETFSERFEGFPVNVAAMSRFQTTKEINEAIEGLETGTVDVVIGTHKLLNPKIKFKDLGLVIIDEEQRFGVEHKETLKALRTNVDVLSLSATPIPRTLEMAVTGIREMSTLATPPEDRLPVLTYVGAYEDAQVTAAVRRELLRGGQVFYVHNRVQDISSIADKIHTLVPEAHVGIAHGKMGEKQLDQIIRDFWHRDIDVLVCTTIIETGLDISNANTLIVDHADRFGLSQLHQLRGRVGRGRERAYAYFLYDPSKPMTEQSHDRLATIAQNTALGSGFDVAMKDLELRGTGNLLGDEQSGHIEGVGFDLYVRMVSEAVEKYKEPEENVEPVAVSIDLPIEASIPIEYIDSDKLRLEAYRKLASARNEADLKDLEEELTDRYGKPPVEFETLFDVARLKFKARKLGISEILAQSNRVRIGRIDPPESIQMRMGRIYKGTQYRPVTHQLIVPTPFTGSLGQGPMSSDQVVLWTNQLLDDLAWTPSSSKRQSRL